MKLITTTPQKALKALLKRKVLRVEIDDFKTNLKRLLQKIATIETQPSHETEEHLKNNLRDFLRDTYYQAAHAINTKDKKDLVIHTQKNTDSAVAVIIEAKRPSNASEMITPENPNKKALHELILYYLHERIQLQNFELKHLIITNINQWYIIDANDFDKYIYNNTQIKNLYKTKNNDHKSNPFFYEALQKIVEKMDIDLPCVYFDITTYDHALQNDTKENDRELIALYKILAPQHLLKIPTENDGNSLNEKFYKELLHLIGLEETKENGKNIICRKKQNRHPAAIIELTIDAIITQNLLHKLPDPALYGSNADERTFNAALELCITWINRVLFLKLLEAQLIAYHQGDKNYQFLNIQTVNGFDELFNLFHKVLAVNLPDRTPATQIKYANVPYLNSSLFEITELEDQIIKINSLDNNPRLELLPTTVLKPIKQTTNSLPTVAYLFQFLDAYDFAGETTDEPQDDNKTIINASVLGKVFEKINGYKDGSIFTPAFITMYMCRQSIRLAVVEKFNAIKQWNITQFDEIYNKITDKHEANQIINTLKICDPAVGSGHFLVAALNEIIAIKSELNVLMDENGKTLRDYAIQIIDDELIITNENGGIFAYYPKSEESNRVQKTLFHEKQTIIENCLFGVDINPNSVKICRLRLWIELLKNAYYKKNTHYTQLETLPNIDINIKCGNSLLSRFALDADLSKALKSIKYDVAAYRGFVQDYKNEKNRDVKQGIQLLINAIKADFRTEINKNDPKQTKLNRLSGDLFNLLNQTKLFDLDSKQTNDQKEQQDRLQADITKLAAEIDDIKNNVVYKNAFEWRFEFPEVMNNNGDFEGFDLIIGNPPYIDYREINPLLTKELKHYSINFESPRPNLYQYFIERCYHVAKPKAQVWLINPTQFLSIDAGFGTRKFLIENTIIQSIDDVSYLKVFENAATYTMVWSFRKEKNGNYPVSISKSRTIEAFGKVHLIVRKNDIIANGKYLIIANVNQVLINKIEKNKTKLGEISQMVWGTSQSGYGKLKIETEAFLQLSEKEQSDYAPIIQTRDIKKYEIKWAGQHIPKSIFTDNIKKKFAVAEKIVIARMTLKLQASLDLNKNYVGKSTILTLDKQYSYKYMLAVLNSTLIDFWYKNYFENTHLSGGYIRFDIPYLKKIPIYQPTAAQAAAIAALVDEIIAQKAAGEPSQATENQIDQYIYTLYDLTPAEQNLIENSKNTHNLPN